MRLVGEGSGDAAGTSVQSNAETSTTQGSSTQYVKRVTFSPCSSLPCNVGDSAYFDISDGSDVFSPSVRMISCSDAGTCKDFQRGLSLHGMFHEYALEPAGDGIDRFRMQSLPQVDDFEHFTENVAIDYKFDLYDADLTNKTNFKRRFCDSQCFRPSCQQRLFQSQPQPLFQQPEQPCFQFDLQQPWSDDRSFSVRAISTGHDIVVDSGSDATVLPIHLNHAGTPCADQDSRLRDAQGNAIQVDSVKDICFDLQTDDGRTVTIRDTAHFSNAVDSPIISYGKLLRNGWGIVPDDTGSFLTHARGFKIPMNFRNNSLVIHGHVRVIENKQTVRVIHVDVPRSWQKLQSGWWEFGDSMMIYVSGAQKHVDVTSDVLVNEWPYRTTVAWSEHDGWCVLELCEKIFDLEERCKPIGQPYKNLLTIVTKNVCTIDQLGMVLNEQLGQQVQGGAQSSSSSTVAQAPQDVQMSDALQPHTTDAQRSSEIPVTIDATGGVQSAGVTIAGITVTPSSSIALLRASCKYLEISQSGSKSKLWNRIIAHLDKLKILEEVEIMQSSLQESARNPVPVQTAEKPDDEDEIKRHQLTHTPYAAWCESCVQGKGRAERHETDSSRLQDRELPSLSFDFAYTGKSCESVDVDTTTSKLTTLVFHDSHSGAVRCVPVFAKSQRKYMVMEAVRFLQFLGHSDICLRCDQEPAILAVQNLLQRTWQRMGHHAVIENSKLLDHASNSWVEKAVDNVRNMSSVLLHELSKRLNYEIPVGHPLFSWAFIHACWIRNRYGVRAGVTSYELIREHAYRGRSCQFAEPVMCFVGDTNQHKGDPKWRPGIFLTKSVTNDMFLVQCEGNLRLTRSVKAIFKDWSEHMELYRSLLTFPLQIEGVLGNRVKPVSKSYLGVPGIIPGIDDEAAPDPDEPDEVDATAGTGSAVLQDGDGTELQTFPVTPLMPLIPLAPRTPMPEPTQEVQAPRRTPPPPTAVVSAPVEGAEQAGPMQHVDMDVDELFESVSHEAFFTEYFGNEDTTDDAPFMDDDCLWQPFSELEPCLDPELLAKIDEYGDKVEIMRLTSMQVLTTPEQYTGECGKPLSAKFVRTWRKKTRKEYDSAGNLVSEGPAWMRRSRLVAREFNWLESREDTFSPATSSAVVKLLPALAMSDGFIPNAVLGTLDISDAFLQVPQSLPRAVTINGCSHIILRCLPGQRDASRLWFNYFVGRVQHHVDAVSCKEQPCILRVKNFGVLLLHVDDVLFMGDEKWLRDTLIPKLESEFKMTYTIISRETGGGFEFLKRYHSPFTQRPSMFALCLTVLLQQMENHQSCSRLLACPLQAMPQMKCNLCQIPSLQNTVPWLG